VTGIALAAGPWTDTDPVAATRLTPQAADPFRSGTMRGLG